MEELKNQLSYKIISQDVNNFVKSSLKGYLGFGNENDEHEYITKAKIIHDPIWGSTEYEAWEMQIIDSPLIQRLRNISQVGLAVLTYPAARHSRFEHTLGVAAVTKRLVNRININCAKSGENFHDIKEPVKCKLILAAIMHDVGHCFYSHLSESVYGDLEDFVKLKTKINEIYGLSPKPHEILSFIIVNCDSFKDFFRKKVCYPYKDDLDELFEDVGKIIIGKNIEKGTVVESYQTSIINGDFDADKLDYIKRDSYTAGLSLDFDIERLFTKIKICDVDIKDNFRDTNFNKERRLVIEASGVTAIEELTFCKIMLYSYIYHHQKVLITEDMIKDYVQGLLELKIIKSYADFLRFDETILLELSKKQGNRKPFPKYGEIDLELLANNIRNRILPKRCFEISRTFVKEIAQNENKNRNEALANLLIKIRNSNDKDYKEEDFEKDIKSFPDICAQEHIAGCMQKFEKKTFENILITRKKIYKELCNIYKTKGKTVDFSVFDIYCVFPKQVSYGSSIGGDNVVWKKVIGKRKVEGEKKEDFTSIAKFVKLGEWANTFNAYKWRGYVYVTEKFQVQGSW